MYGLSSSRLHKALSQNSYLESELNKDLAKLDNMKEVSGKQQKKRREAFLRQHRKRWPAITKSNSDEHSTGVGNFKLERGWTGELTDLKRSRSTGQLYEESTWLESEVGTENSNVGKIKNADSHNNTLNANKEEGISTPSDKLLQRFTRLSLDVPKSPKTSRENTYRRSSSVKDASSGTQGVAADRKSRKPEDDSRAAGVSDTEDVDKTWVTRQYVDYDSGNNHLTLPRINNRLSKSDSTLHDNINSNGFNEQTQHQSSSRRPSRSNTRNGTTKLSLPSLERTRSRSSDGDIRGGIRSRSREPSPAPLPGLTTLQASSPKRQSVSSGSPRRGSQKISSRSEDDARFSCKGLDGDSVSMGKKRSNNKPRPGLLHRSSSTPELTDMEPEVDYLLMSSDQTTLRRFRAAVVALKAAGDIHECRYLRKRNSDECELPKIRIGSSAGIASRDSGHPEEHALDSSYPDLLDTSSASLAELFEELKNTRYLRLRSRSDSDNEEGGDSACSELKTPPLIIIGHTQAVLAMARDDRDDLANT